MIECQFKKIYGLIPLELFEKLKSKNLFNSSWDSWLTNAIIEKLEVDFRQLKGKDKKEDYNAK